MLTIVLVVFVLLLCLGAYIGYVEAMRPRKPYESGIDSVRVNSGVDPDFNPRQRSSLPAVQDCCGSTPAPPSGKEADRFSAMPATVPARKPHGRPSVKSESWTRTTDDTPTQHFTIGYSFGSSSDSSSSYDSGSSSSYDGGGGDSGGGGSSGDW